MNKLIIIALALSLAACGHSKKKTSDHKSNIDLTAAGATFPLPYYNLAFKTYKDSTGVSVTYGGIGSGGGIRSLKDRIVDFAGSDAYLSEAEMAEMPAPVVHIPTCMGAVSATPGDAGAIGLLYQWGRKDPFVQCNIRVLSLWLTTYPK